MDANSDCYLKGKPFARMLRTVTLAQAQVPMSRYDTSVMGASWCIHPPRLLSEAGGCGMVQLQF